MVFWKRREIKTPNVTVRGSPPDGLQQSRLPLIKKPTLPAGMAGSPFDRLVGHNESTIALSR